MIGEQIFKLAERLWPINRSLTGRGVRETLKILQEVIPSLQIKSIKSGTSAFDWKIPDEWECSEAYIITPEGEKICDFKVNNLHLVGYSEPIDKTLSLDELQNNLYSLPEQPNAIPYVTSYYSKRWGFCISHNQRDTLRNGSYKVRISSKHFKGQLNYGELIIKGESSKEVFLSTYICHPSMANNELSGPTVTAFVAKWITENIPNPRFTYRIIFIPETIGSIAYLSLHHKELRANVVAGFNITCIGDERAYSYLPSRNGNTYSDLISQHVLKHIDENFVSYTWLDRGSDERQYCAPGIDLPVASIMRTKYGEYPEYHTSLDTLSEVVTPKGLTGGYLAITRAIETIENDKIYNSTVLCEPQMGKRGLYPNISFKRSAEDVKRMMDLLSLCDGKKSLLEIAEFLAIPLWALYPLLNTLIENRLIEEV